jgi:FkbM family methyltransferase
MATASLSSFGRKGIDRRLASYLPSGQGIFVEAGANDGITESNTLALEREHGWTGLLIEPAPDLAAACRARRSNAAVAEVALVPPEHTEARIAFESGGLMSVVRGARGSVPAERAWADMGIVLQPNASAATLDVIAHTLSTVIDEYGMTQIDFLSLDVEGYEAAVLRGLNLRRHRPKLILVETWAHTSDEIAQLLLPLYTQIAVLGYLEEDRAPEIALKPGEFWEALYQVR